MIVSMLDERDERRHHILDAAYVCFVRHGVRRTTMEDIARAADMSRPAIYQYFRNKDDVFRRLAGRVIAEARSRARAEAASPGTLTQRLDRVLAVRLGLTQQLAQDTPHAAELFSPAAQDEYDLALSDVITVTIIEAAVQADLPLGEANAREVAELLLALARGLEHEPGRARERLRNGVALLVAGLAAAAQPART